MNIEISNSKHSSASANADGVGEIFGYVKTEKSEPTRVGTSRSGDEDSARAENVEYDTTCSWFAEAFNDFFSGMFGTLLIIIAIGIAGRRSVGISALRAAEQSQAAD